jgi:hypothetical protein
MTTLNEGLKMRFLKVLCVTVLLAIPVAALADARDVPGSAEWYLHIDFDKMKSEEAGKAVYEWFQAEALDEVRDDAGIDIDKEVSKLTAFSIAGEGPVVVVDGKFSQQTYDKIMAIIAAEGDISPLKASGRKYYRIGEDGEVAFKGDDGNVDIKLDSLDEGGWISMDIRDKILFTGSEEQMKALLANKGRVPRGSNNSDALLVLTAEKTLLQAGMNSGLVDDDGNADWDSNILRNTEQVAFLVAAAANKLAIEAKLITAEPEMAESLASVARGLISLASFDDSMEPETAAVLQGTRVEAKGNSLSLSLAVDPSLVVRTLDN